MVAQDRLTDDKVGMNRRCGSGTVTGLLTGERKPSLAEIRNALAHGDPLGTMPMAGCSSWFDLIEYAYRNSG
jgi:hypothetical protein